MLIAAAACCKVQTGAKSKGGASSEREEVHTHVPGLRQGLALVGLKWLLAAPQPDGRDIDVSAGSEQEEEVVIMRPKQGNFVMLLLHCRVKRI